jgi:lipopolysaccharide biosynthesis glycosyltransferase
MKKAIVFVLDQSFVEQTEYIIGALRKYGKWAGDIVLLANNIKSEAVRAFDWHGVKVIPINEQRYWMKAHCFSQEMRHWDKLLCLEQDYVIFGDVNPLFEQADGLLCADRDHTHLYDQFYPDADRKLYSELETLIDMTSSVFNASCLLFATKDIPENAFAELNALRKKYEKINRNIGDRDGWADQPILNIYFYKRWQQIKGVCFHGVKTDDILAAHTTHWHAPWSPETGLRAYYDECLEHYKNEKR